MSLVAYTASCIQFFIAAHDHLPVAAKRGWLCVVSMIEGHKIIAVQHCKELISHLYYSQPPARCIPLQRANTLLCIGPITSLPQWPDYFGNFFAQRTTTAISGGFVRLVVFGRANTLDPYILV